MPTGPGVLKVYEAGTHTIVGFSRNGVQRRTDVPRWHHELVKLIDQYKCELLTFDLTGVKKLSNGMLDLLFALGQRGVQVRIYNPSTLVRDVLKVTRLNGIVSEVEALYSADAT
jgi:hypothetical protein